MSSQPTKFATTGFIVDSTALVTSDGSGKRVAAPEARDAISSLQQQRIPFVIVSRDTKVTEKEAADDLSSQLGVKIKPHSILLPQSPFRDFVGEYKDKVVLVLGGQGEKARGMALEYGFEHVMTSRDVAEMFDGLYGKYLRGSGRQSKPERAGRRSGGTTQAHAAWKSALGKDIQISAIFVWWESDNWDLDTQLCVDLLLSDGGRIGTSYSADNNNNDNKNIPQLGRHAPNNQPRLFICLTDTASRNGLRAPVRNGRTWLETLMDRWAAATAASPTPVALDYAYCGLGRDSVTLHYADKLLNGQCRKGMGVAATVPFPRTVYMIGAAIEFGADSEEHLVLYAQDARRRSIRVDVAGAGRLSVHDFHPVTRPWHVARTAREAVDYALTEEYWDCVEAGLAPLFPKPARAETSAVY